MCDALHCSYLPRALRKQTLKTLGKKCHREYQIFENGKMVTIEEEFADIRRPSVSFDHGPSICLGESAKSIQSICGL